MTKRIGVGLLVISIYGICLELGERFEIPGVRSFVSTAEAVIGRPATPVSVAGVARRSRATMCSGRLLLGPSDRWGEAGLNLSFGAGGKGPATAGVSCWYPRRLRPLPLRFGRDLAVERGRRRSGSGKIVPLLLPAVRRRCDPIPGRNTSS